MHSKEFSDSISQFRTCGWKVLLFRKLNWDEAKVLWCEHYISAIQAKTQLHSRRCESFTLRNPMKPDFVSDDWWIFIFFWSFHRYPASTPFYRFHSDDVVSFIFEVRLTCSFILVFRPYFLLSSLSRSLSHSHSFSVWWYVLEFVETCCVYRKHYTKTKIFLQCFLISVARYNQCYWMNVSNVYGMWYSKIAVVRK